MIAIAPISSPAPRRTNTQNNWQDRYLLLLPKIRLIARCAFRKLPAEEREDAIEEVIANTFAAYGRLVERGKESIAYAWPLSRYAVAQYRAGRRVGSSLNVHDVLSPNCQKRNGLASRSFSYCHKSSQWEELAVEDRRATPADVAACRLDFRAWLRGLERAKRTAAELLAGGATTMDAAQQLGLSQSRVSQLRRELKEAWEQFQGEAKEVAAA
ncbi:hypothetical protein ETAA8_58340 [Anatilimnocola aggregata]|uniref:Uncharacterized protein n=1 Tax=Anatilimnocola aggregata TaxID=2528021 RepID=A0A517YKE6_9BACT|nr:hypothetical protein [Anatilimnocola aggregata]QDU30687.1 hypothetical protein ETAA8_58340 [Anatilimnocola aggregata]